MAFTLNIKTGNAAFEGEDARYELSRILRELADELGEWGTENSGKVMDINGNTVGAWELTDD